MYRLAFFSVAAMFFPEVLMAIDEEQIAEKLIIIRHRQETLVSSTVDLQNKVFLGFALAFGWIVTSAEARFFLQQNAIVRSGAVLVVGALVLCVQLTFVNHYLNSENLYELLKESDIYFQQLDNLRAASWKFDLTNLLFTLFFNAILFISLASLILTQKRPSK